MRLIRLAARVLFGADSPSPTTPAEPENIVQPSDAGLRLPRDVSELDRELNVIRDDITHLQAELRAHIVVGHREGEHYP